MNISVHRVTRCGKHAVAAYSLNARQASGFDELQPFFDSAGSAAVAVVVDQTFTPRHAKALIIGARQEHRILARNMALIIEAI